MFYSHEKLFIKADFYQPERHADHLLVYDMRNDFFYLHPNTAPSCADQKEKRVVFAARRDGEVYSAGVRSTGAPRTVRNEIRRWRVVDGKHLVDGGEEWASVDRRSYDEGFMWSACYV